MVLCCLSDVCPLSVRVCDYIDGNGLCVCSPVRLCARMIYALFNGNGSDTHSRKYLSSFVRWLSRLVGFALTVKLTVLDSTLCATIQYLTQNIKLK